MSCNNNLVGQGTLERAGPLKGKDSQMAPNLFKGEGRRGLEHHFSAVLQLPGVESAHRTPSLCKGIVGFADIDAIEKVEHIETEFDPAFLSQNNPASEAKIDRREIASPVNVSTEIANRSEGRLDQPDCTIWRGKRSCCPDRNDAGPCG